MIAAVVAATVAVVGIVLTAVRVAYKFGEWKGEVNADRKLFTDFITEVKGFMVDVKDFMFEVKGFMFEVKGFMNEDKEKIDRILKRLPLPPAVEENSPVQLTEFGKKISENLSIGKWTVEHAANLVKQVSKKQDFEIFEMCIEYVSGQYDADSNFQRKIRKGAYESGINVEQVKRVYEVKLRDALLALQNS